MRFAQIRHLPESTMPWAVGSAAVRDRFRARLRSGPILELIGVGVMMAAFMALAIF